MGANAHDTGQITTAKDHIIQRIMFTNDLWRLTIMAAIMVMDELTERQKRVKGMESEIITLRKTRDDALVKADKNDSALTGALTGLAQRMETLAERLAVQKAN